MRAGRDARALCRLRNLPRLGPAAWSHRPAPPAGPAPHLLRAGHDVSIAVSARTVARRCRPWGGGGGGHRALAVLLLCRSDREPGLVRARIHGGAASAPAL